MFQGGDAFRINDRSKTQIVAAAGDAEILSVAIGIKVLCIAGWPDAAYGDQTKEG